MHTSWLQGCFECAGDVPWRSRPARRRRGRHRHCRQQCFTPPVRVLASSHGQSTGSFVGFHCEAITATFTSAVWETWCLVRRLGALAQLFSVPSTLVRATHRSPHAWMFIASIHSLLCYFTTHAAVVPVPPNVAPEAACTVPTVFLTADACLNAATILQPGSTVLIHAATGLT